MKHGIKAKDIRDFEKYASKLNEVIERIKKYQPDANIFATPNQLNLMYAQNKCYHWRIENEVEDPVVSSVTVNMDCGDW